MLRLGEGGLTPTKKRETASHGTDILVFVFSIKYTKRTEVCYNYNLKTTRTKNSKKLVVYIFFLLKPVGNKFGRKFDYGYLIVLAIAQTQTLWDLRSGRI